MRSLWPIAFLLCASCDVVRLIQRDEEARADATRYLLEQGICRPDTVTIRRTDTVVRIDTVGEIYIFSDTSYVNDTLRIYRERLREVLKTMTIRDTLWQTLFDRAREDALVIDLKDCRADNEAYRRSQRVWRWAGIGMLLLILTFLIVALKRF
jgi:hypothetical protein